VQNDLYWRRLYYFSINTPLFLSENTYLYHIQNSSGQMANCRLAITNVYNIG
jgi:hypothetical protein